MEVYARLRYLWASITYRNKPVIKKVREDYEPVEEAVRHCPRRYRYMCYVAAKELNISLAAVAEAGRDVPTAVALALEDVTTGSPEMPRFWKYVKTGEVEADLKELLEKWRRAFSPQRRPGG
ncbi:MAG: hypothetical protein QXP31_06550 [Pyrobaculum sp.]